MFTRILKALLLEELNDHRVIIARDLKEEVARGSCLQIHGTALPASPNPLIRFMPRSFSTINHGPHAPDVYHHEAAYSPA